MFRNALTKEGKLYNNVVAPTTLDSQPPGVLSAPRSVSPAPNRGGAGNKTNSIDTALVLDISNSMRETDFPPSRLGAAKEAALKLVNERVATGSASRICIVGFETRSVLACALVPCSDVAALTSAIHSLGLGRDTNITAGLEMAEALLKQILAGTDTEVVVLSDGIHNVGPTPHDAAERLKAKGCIIRTVGIAGSPKVVGEKMLKQVASTDAYGNPRYRFIGDKDGLVRHFGEIGGLTR